jgi:hypothetical protein
VNECNNGFVTNVGAPCPFPAGSGLNTQFNGGRIVEIGNPNVTGDYASDSSEFVNDVTSGNGQVWVQYGQIDNSGDYGMLVNLYQTLNNSDNSVSYLVDNGNGGQLELGIIPDPYHNQDAFNWTEYFHIPGT